MKNIYQTMYSEKNKVDLTKNPRIQIMRKIINDLNLANKNILDIGCYDDVLLSLIKNKNNNFYGLDTSQWALAECRHKNIQAQEFFWDDNRPLPYQDNFFDLIIAGEIIEHIFDTDYFLQEVKRALKPEGKFLISTPNIASLGRRIYLLFGKNPLIETSVDSGNSGHIRYFTFKTLFKLLEKNGFRVLGKKSDVINFSKKGRPCSKFMADIFPFFGQSIICLADKI